MLLSQQLCCFSEGGMAWPTSCHHFPGHVFSDCGDFHLDRRLKKIAVEQLIGIASCVIWKWLLKHRREERDQKSQDLNPIQSFKSPNNFCHFCFFFSRDLDGICFIFLNFSQNHQGEKHPFSEIGCFVGSGTRVCQAEAQTLADSGHSTPRAELGASV